MDTNPVSDFIIEELKKLLKKIEDISIIPKIKYCINKDKEHYIYVYPNYFINSNGLLVFFEKRLEKEVWERFREEVFFEPMQNTNTKTEKVLFKNFENL